MKINKNYVGIFIEDEEKRIMFQLRDNKKNIPHPNRWSLFGGGIKKGEEPVEAIMREIKEELEFSIDRKKLRLLIRSKVKNASKYIFYYQLENDEKLFHLKEGQKYMFLSPYRLLVKRNVVPSLRIFLLIYPFLKRCKLKQ